MKGSVVASPTVIGGRLFVVTRSRMLYCFGSTEILPQSPDTLADYCRNGVLTAILAVDTLITHVLK